MFDFKSILFPIEFSQRDEAAAPFVLSMAQRYQARVVLLHAIQPPPPVYTGMNEYPQFFDFEAAERDLRESLYKFADAQLPRVNLECVVLSGEPAAVIAEYACNSGLDLIAMPTHGYGIFRRALLGSVTAKVLHDSKLPVWTDAHAPEPSHRAHPQPRRVLCALDMSEESRHTLEAAMAVANHAGATLEIVHSPAETASPATAQQHLDELLGDVALAESVEVEKEIPGMPEREGRTANIAEVVRDVAIRKRVDLVVIGRGAIRGTLGRLHSHSYNIIRESPCPVLSV